MQNPLFPPDDDDEDAPDIEQIHVTRFSAEGQQWCGYLFGADELTELQQIQEMFGGGKYELVGRCGGRIAARRRYSLDGRPRPLVYGLAPVHEPAPAPTQQAQPVQPMPQVPQGGTDMLGLILAMNQSSQQMMMGVLQTVTTMATAMVSRDSESSRSTLEAMSGVQRQAMEQQSNFFTAIMAAKNGGHMSTFREGLDLGKEIAAKGGGKSDDEDDEDEDEIGKTVGQVFEGLKVLGQVTGSGDAPAAGGE